MKTFIREKKIYCGNEYMEVDIYPLSENQLGRKKGQRSKKKKTSLPAQENLNDKNARRKFIQVAETNFGKNDLSVTLTYSDEFLPETLEDAEREVQNYIKRIRRRRKKEGVEDLKYMLITSSREITEDETEKPVRIHHHILMNGGLDRDTVEKLWSKRKRAGEKEGRPIGYANADRIQPDYNTGIAALCNYLIKNPTQKRRWTCSQNLERPKERTNDHKYSRKKVIEFAYDRPSIEFWEKIYPGWTITDKLYGFEAIYSEMTGWSLYLKLRRKPNYKKE